MWELDCKGWVLKNWCFQTVALEKILEIPLESKEIKPVNPKGNWRWIFIGRTDAKSEAPNTLGTWCEELTHWKRPWRWERLRASGEGDSRGWDGWMASLTQWTWVSANSERWWRTGKPGMLQFTGSQDLDKAYQLNDIYHSWCSVPQSCQSLCDSMDCSKPGFSVFHHPLEFAQTHVHWVRDTIQTSCPAI